MIRIIIVLIVSCCIVPTADASCFATGGGCSVCCSGPDHCSTSCPKPIHDWRVMRKRRIEVDAGAVLVLTGDDQGTNPGIQVSAGYHQLVPFRESILGNERGAELTAEYVWNAGETHVWVAPVFRVARASRIRTTSLVGALLPGVGARLRESDPDQIMFRWSPYPIDLRIRRWLALAVEPITVSVGIGGGYSGWLSSSIQLSVGTP